MPEEVKEVTSTEKQFSWKRLLITSAIVVFTAVITFGITWYLLDKSAKESDEASNRLRVELQKEIDELRAKLKTTTDSSDDLTYKNETYGFELTFPEDWEEFKILEKTVSGATKTWYVELPTTDTNWSLDTSTSDAGYVSFFAISAYTDSQWAENQAEPAPSTEITKVGEYTYGYTRAQAAPDSLTDKFDDIKTIVTTLKGI